MVGGTPSFTGTANITKASITNISNISALNKIYDGSTSATLNTTGAIFNGIYAGDQLSVEKAKAVFDTPDIGIHKVVNISGITLGGASVLNYQLVSTTSQAYADILPSTVATVSAKPTITNTVILSTINQNIITKNLVVKPETYVTEGKLYDYNSFVFDLNSEVVQSRKNLISTPNALLNYTINIPQTVLLELE